MIATVGGAFPGEGSEAEEEVKDSRQESGQEDGEMDHEADADVLPGSAGQQLVTSSSPWPAISNQESLSSSFSSSTTDDR